MEQKRLAKETFRIAWPAVVESVFIVLVGMLDTYMVSPLGKQVISGISLANQPKILIYIVFFAANAAISPLIARRKGSDNKYEAHVMYMTGLLYTLVAGIALSIVCVVFAEPIILLFGGNADTTPIAVLYFRIIMGGNITCEMLLTRIGFAVNAMITARIGTEPYAAHSVGMHFMNLGFAFGDGMQMAAVSLIGMNLGAKNKENAKKISIIAQKTDKGNCAKKMTMSGSCAMGWNISSSNMMPPGKPSKTSIPSYLRSHPKS